MCTLNSTLKNLLCRLEGFSRPQSAVKKRQSCKTDTLWLPDLPQLAQKERADFLRDPQTISRFLIDLKSPSLSTKSHYDDDDDDLMGRTC